MSTQILLDLLKNGNHTLRIKLLGDSITHGHSGTGYAQDGDPIVGGFRQNPNGYCWANLFRDHMEKNYDCKVINYGRSGTNIQSIIRDLDALVSQDDDIVICTIGTNNRHQFFREGEKRSREEQIRIFHENVLQLSKKLKEKNIPFIFNANIPASEKNEQDGENYWRIIHMNDINDIYKQAAAECDFPLISLYDSFTEHCKSKDITVDSLLSDGLHPNDKGYEVMFQLMLRELELS